MNILCVYLHTAAGSNDSGVLVIDLIMVLPGFRVQISGQALLKKQKEEEDSA